MSDGTPDVKRQDPDTAKGCALLMVVTAIIVLGLIVWACTLVEKIVDRILPPIPTQHDRAEHR